MQSLLPRSFGGKEVGCLAASFPAGIGLWDGMNSQWQRLRCSSGLRGNLVEDVRLRNTKYLEDRVPY